MTNTELWKKICEFKLDDSDAEVKFSDKLCKEESWSKTLAILSISEYKKFIYLCITQPNGASPSEEIDKVWHLHLTYTDNYWNEFCKKTLGREVHHYPSKGGEKEDKKHLNWYNDTIVAYIKEFGEIPPGSVWTLPEGFDLEKYLPQNSPFRTPVYDEIGSPFELGIVKRILLGCGIALAILLYFTKNPYRLSGPGFLGFYTGLLLIGFMLIYANKLFKENVALNLSTQLHTLHVSAVYKGLETTMRMLTVNLVEKGLLSFNGEEFEHAFDKNEPLFYSIQAHENNKIGIKAVRLILLTHVGYFMKLTKSLRDSVESKGEYFLIFHFVIILIGVLRVIQGVENGKPVLYLIALIAFYVIAGFLFSRFAIQNKDSVKHTVVSNVDNFDFTSAASNYLFTGFYLLDDKNGIDSTYAHHYVERERHGDSGGSGSSCGSDGGGGDGGGCSSGCGGCGGGD